ncbi:MAG: multicomponent Na+:H+ antiporter subunit G [Verrucomicrobiales bacterium]|jgi:multicomponent Na+:H+ antiporter subunit G
MNTTIEMILDIAGLVLIGFGLLFFLGGAIGLVRFPDFYTRMHAAGKGDTLSTLLILSGFALCHVNDIFEAEHWWQPLLLIVKLLGISIFIMVTSPTSTHALIEAGYDDGIKPEVERDALAEKREGEAE